MIWRCGDAGLDKLVRLAADISRQAAESRSTGRRNTFAGERWLTGRGEDAPRISFRRSLKLTSCTAFNPPKERDRLRTSRTTSPVPTGRLTRAGAGAAGTGTATLTSGAAGVAAAGNDDRLRRKSRTFQNRPSGASRMSL